MTITLQDIQNTARWQRSGEFIYRRPRYKLSCCSVIGDRMLNELYDVLGRVQERSDGRWNWWRKPTYFPNKFWVVRENEQGVADTLEEAKQTVEEGWSN